MLSNTALILSEAIPQSIGPRAHSLVPLGALASHIPNWSLAGCEGYCKSPFFLVSSGPERNSTSKEVLEGNVRR